MPRGIILPLALLRLNPEFGFVAAHSTEANLNFPAAKTEQSVHLR
jgi:hypothetical protein